MSITDQSASHSQRTSPGGSKAPRRLFFAALFLLTAWALVYALINWSGRRAWNQFVQYAQAKGEPLTQAEIIPPAIPDDENAAATPLFKPLLDYSLDPVGKTNRWRDEAGRNRVQSLGAWDTPDPHLKGTWRLQQAIDLGVLQKYYREHGHYPHPAQAGRPGDDILQALTPQDAAWAELREAAARPKARFPLHYEEGYACLLPHLAVMRKLAFQAEIRALAYLDSGRPDEALQEIQLGLKLASWLREEPLVVSQLVRIAMLEVMLQPIWEGMARRQWSPAQLAMLEQACRGIQIMPGFQRCLRGERILGGDSIELMRQNPEMIMQMLFSSSGSPETQAPFVWSIRYFPRGWFQWNQAALAQGLCDISGALVDPVGQRLTPTVFEQSCRSLERTVQEHPYRLALLARMLPALQRIGLRFAALQTGFDLAAGAAVLEQHQRTTGTYPASWKELPETVLARVPRDPLTGELFRYELRSNQRFVLYSPGWDEKDNHGQVQANALEQHQWDSQKGDWAWAYPAP